MLFAVVLFTVGMAGRANALVDGAPAPTISSDKADCAPGETVNLAGSNWQPGESVHINVNDDAGKTWSRDADVTADENDNIQDQFQLPDWFVAQYNVTATGAQSGEAKASFTDAAVVLQGQSNPACTSGAQCDTGGYQAGNLTGWKELDQIPLRLKFSSTGTYTVHVSFDHSLTSDSTKTGIQDLYNWVAGSGLSFASGGQPTLTNTSGDSWEYTLKVNVTSADSVVRLKGNLSAGAHNFNGSSLALQADNGGGKLQIVKPAAAPGSPDLAVTKTGPANAAPGSNVTYTLNYQNKSSATSAATGAQLTDILPSGVSYVNGSCSNTCSVAGNEVVWTLTSLSPGATGSRTLQVSIPSNAAFGTRYTDTARILSAENDAALGDNTSSLTTTVQFNRGPVANNDSLTTDEDTAGKVNVLSNDTDPDNDTLSVTGKTNGAHGTVSCTSAGVCTYTPDPNYNGTDSFTYTVSDGKGGTDTGTVNVTVNVTVNAVNDDPVATDKTYSMDEGDTLTIGAARGLLDGATDVDSSDLYVCSTSIVNSNGNNGNFTLNAREDGSFTFTPQDPNFNGEAFFYYKVCDRSGGQSAQQKVTITINPVNDAPRIDLNGDDPGTGDSATYTEGDPGVLADSGQDLTITDVDSNRMKSATVKIANHKPGDLLTINANAAPAITVTSYDPDTGLLALSGVAPKDDYQSILRTVRYRNTSATARGATLRSASRSTSSRSTTSRTSPGATIRSS